MGATLHQLIEHYSAQNSKIIVFADTHEYNGIEIRKEFLNSMKIVECYAQLYKFEVDNLEKDKVEIRRIIYEHKDFDITFCPSPLSMHQDHRLIGEAVNDIFVEKTVFFYEDVRSGQFENVNVWNKVSEEDMEFKYSMMAQYHTQLKKRHYFNNETMRTMARFRGGQVNVEYAEGFECKRLIM